MNATTVLLVVGTDAPADAALQPRLGGADAPTYLSPGDPDAVVVDLVCRRPPATPLPGVRRVVAVAPPAGLWPRLERTTAAARAVAAARRTPAGRLALSLSPFDGGRQMWRAVRATPAARDLAAQAALVVAVDDEGVRTAWEWRRAGVVPEAFQGLLAAARLLATRRP